MPRARTTKNKPIGRQPRPRKMEAAVYLFTPFPSSPSFLITCLITALALNTPIKISAALHPTLKRIQLTSPPSSRGKCNTGRLTSSDGQTLPPSTQIWSLLSCKLNPAGILLPAPAPAPWDYFR